MLAAPLTSTLERKAAAMERYWRELPPNVDMFAYASNFVSTTLLPDVPVVKENRQAVWASLEKPYFRPAVELLVAGLISGRGPLGKQTLAAHFVASTVDHLIMGWNALMLSYLRVASTLSRHVAESAIFQTASVFSPVKFAAIWESDRATGGQVLREVQSALPTDLAKDLQASWKLVVSFGHVNPGAVWLSKLHGSVVGDPTRHAVTFDGPHNGPLQEHAIVHMACLFSLSDGSTSFPHPCPLSRRERGTNPRPPGEGGAQRRVREVFDFSFTLNRDHMAMIFTALAESALRAFAASFNERLSPEWSSAFAAQNALVIVRQAEQPAS